MGDALQALGGGNNVGKGGEGGRHEMRVLSASDGGGILAEEHFLRVCIHRGRHVDGLGQIVSAPCGRPCGNAFKPGLEMRKLRDVLLLAFVRHDPGVAGHVGDGVALACNIVAAVAQVLVEHAVEAAGFLHIALHGVGDLLGRVLGEVVVLPGHGAQAAHLPEQPLNGLVAPAQILGDELLGLVGKIQQDRAGLEHRNRRAAIRWRLIDDGRDAVVGRDFQKVRSKLLAPADVDRMDLVGQPGLLQEHRDLVAVGGGPVVQVDHPEISV
ncbi:hypothetical protein SDC9_136810 [bioreactor metagenome]|uniref:Uncharacterized protein n=1 Tax=bioreactor metagenome TaxID=1076179 RepID=A0A645DKW0_9ZZZZ